MIFHQFVGLTTEQWEDVIDFIGYATQSGLSSDDEEERGLAIIEAIKEQTYGNDDTELDTPFEEETESYEETASY